MTSAMILYGLTEQFDSWSSTLFSVFGDTQLFPRKYRGKLPTQMFTIRSRLFNKKIDVTRYEIVLIIAFQKPHKVFLL